MELPISLANGSAVGALVVILVGLIWLVAKGLIIPRSIHEARLTDRDARIKDLLDANDKSAKQAEKLTVVAEQQVQIMRSIEALAKERHE